MLVRVLLITSDQGLKRRIQSLLGLQDVLVSSPKKIQEFWQIVSTENFDLLITDDTSLPKPESDTVGAIRSLPERPDVVVLQKENDSLQSAGLLAAGCLAVVDTGMENSMIGDILSMTIDRRREQSLQSLQIEERQGPAGLSGIITKSLAMHSVLETARRVVDTDTTLLILGETGVGKEWLARAIHEDGLRSSGSFIPLNCGAIPETLLESELFGHEEGAFTGANRAHRGHFELAHRGTLFLDEIAEMPIHLQAKLLRVLQEKKIKRVGGEYEIVADARVMAATNRDLETEMEARRFRPDLFYRIGVVTITVPPLRDRREDLPDLIRNQLVHFQARLGRRLTGIEPEAMQALVDFEWPGNVRELINVLERAVLMCNSDKVCLRDLPQAISGQGVGSVQVEFSSGNGTAERIPPRVLDMPLKAARTEMIEAFEKAYLTELLERMEGRIGPTARRTGITTRSLYDKMKRYGLRKEDFKV